jgi:hypothetical protein
MELDMELGMVSVAEHWWVKIHSKIPLLWVLFLLTYFSFGQGHTVMARMMKLLDGTPAILKQIMAEAVGKPVEEVKTLAGIVLYQNMVEGQAPAVEEAVPKRDLFLALVGKVQ